MSLLQELNTLLSPIVPVETGIFSESAPNRYVVITPLADCKCDCRKSADYRGVCFFYYYDFTRRLD